MRTGSVHVCWFLLLLATAGCAEPEEWQGITLPAGFHVEEVDSDGIVATLSIDNDRGFEEITDRLDAVLGETWEICADPPADWGADLVGQPRWSFWADSDQERLLVFAQETPESGEGLANKLSLIPGEQTWELIYRGFCEDRDRTLFGPFWLGIARRYCWAADQGQAFASEAWRDADGAGRGSMTADLMCGGDLLGLGPDEVVALLGPPDEHEGPRFLYRVYSESGFSRFKPPAPPPSLGVRCEEGWYELQFDFTIDVPGNGWTVFRLNEACEKTGSS